MARPDTHRGWTTLLALAGASLALAGCGSKTQTAGNDVEMRDMEVVDGTVNDSMTDLDAARVDGASLAENSATPHPRSSRAPDEVANGADTETVPSE